MRFPKIDFIMVVSVSCIPHHNVLKCTELDLNLDGEFDSSDDVTRKKEKKRCNRKRWNNEERKSMNEPKKENLRQMVALMQGTAA